MTRIQRRKTVILFGAGASADCGAPLMRDFFDKAWRLNERGLMGHVAKDLELIKDCRYLLQQAQAKASIDLFNLEQVFAALQMVSTLGGIPRLTAQQAKSATIALQRVIAAVLEQSMSFPVNGSLTDTWVRGTGVYRIIAETLCELKRTQSRVDVGFLTFNYDVALEVALRSAGLNYDYHLSDKVTSDNAISVVKLHGSINWYRLDNSDIEPLPIDVRGQSDLFPGDEPRTTYRTYSFLTQINKKQRDRDAAPFIIPPIDAKSEHHKDVPRVWSRAAELLSAAACVIVVGYSLPETDAFFRQLFALGTLGDTDLEEIVLVDPSKGPETRLRQMLSRVQEERLRVVHKTAVKAGYDIKQALDRRHG